MSVGSKLNTAGKYFTYAQSVIALIFIVTFIVVGSIQLKKKEKKDAATLYTTAASCLLFTLITLYISRRKYGGRILLGGQGLGFII